MNTVNRRPRIPKPFLERSVAFAAIDNAVPIEEALLITESITDIILRLGSTNGSLLRNGTTQKSLIEDQLGLTVLGSGLVVAEAVPETEEYSTPQNVVERFKSVVPDLSREEVVEVASWLKSYVESQQ